MPFTTRSFALFACLLGIPLISQANTPDSIDQQLRFYEYSVERSSVSHLFSDQHKAEKLALIDQAREQAAKGNLRTAGNILQRVGQNLYRMNPVQAEEPEGDRSGYSIDAMLQAVESILPAARQIAKDKKLDPGPLNRVQSEYESARMALKTGDRGTARDLLYGSYRSLKQNVADMRSGELLMINLPAQDSREGWMDAAHRYLDWRYFNRELKSAMLDLEIDTTEVEQANMRADQMYNLASNIALQGEWAQAVETVGQAYRILEKAWQDVGVDIGV